MIEAKNLKFKYGPSGADKFEIKDVSIKPEQGYISCLLGRNGSGKTTLLKLLYGVLKSRGGSLIWNGEKLSIRNIAAYRQEAAFVGAGGWCAEELSIKRNTEIFSTLYPGFDNAYYEELLDMAGLAGDMDKICMSLSQGQRMKAEIVFALARRPKFLLMDEPLANLDPVFKTDILELIQKSVSENETGVLLSTHLCDEISDIVDMIYVIEDGRISRSGSRFELLGAAGERDLKELF